jgi:type I restriction enzyme R subunit
MPAPPGSPSEAATRRTRIDPRLVAQGWIVTDFDPAAPTATYTGHAVREYPTETGPADYALFAGGRLLGILEAKKTAVAPENVLVQAERYARGARGTPFDFRGYKVPFLYSTNGEGIWFRDVRSAAERSREIAEFHTPRAVVEMMGRDLDGACARLAALPNEHPRIRPYQRDANAAVELAISERRRRILHAMATGTGKTFTTVNLVYRLLKAGVVRRVLFLVDRRALAAQAVRAFAAFTPEASLKFDKIYEVYSQHFRPADLGEDDGGKIDLKQIPASYLLDPDPAKPFVYVSTIQRIARNLFGKEAVFGSDEGTAEESAEDDAERLPIPVHAFDLIVADECHRGYSTAEVSLWRATLDHFDAIKVGLTATPTLQTSSYFDHAVPTYGLARAIEDGFLVDYDLVPITSGVRMNGVFLREGEQVELVDPATGKRLIDTLEDERRYDTADLERKITVPDSNRKIVEEVKKYALAHEDRYGRFPKTLIFAVNDIAGRSHAQQLVSVCRDVFGQGEDFVEKITGNPDVDRPLQRIREFRNRKLPGVVVTVDMLSTGVDIPDLEFIVFLRPVRSRVLFEQMMGRGTRRGERHPDKSHFTVFDCFGGTLVAYFKDTTDSTAEMPAASTRSIPEIVEAVFQNEDRAYNVKCLVKRLHRVDKEMSGEGREAFAAFVPDGDLGAFARGLAKQLDRDFTGAMKVLRDPAFQKLTVSFPRPRPPFTVAYGVVDTVSSELLVRDVAGNTYKPQDYLEAWARYVRDNQDRIDAIRILLDRPRGWSPAALAELRQALGKADPHFSVDALRLAHAARYKKDLVDLISMVKHAVRAEEPLLTAAERVDRALAGLTAGVTLSPAQGAWLDRIRAHLTENLSIDRDDFEDMPVFARAGGWKPANDAFGGELLGWIERINEAVAA